MYAYRFDALLRRPDKRFHLLYVFDRALVDVPVGGVGTGMDRQGSAKLMGGAAGGARYGLEVAGRMRERERAAEDVAGSGTAEQLASATAEAELIPFDAVAEVAVAKGRWKARRLEIGITDGRTLAYVYTESAHPVTELRPLFDGLLPGRFRSEVD